MTWREAFVLFVKMPFECCADGFWKFGVVILGFVVLAVSVGFVLLRRLGF